MWRNNFISLFALYCQEDRRKVRREWAKRRGSSDRCVPRHDRKNCLRKCCVWVDWNALKTDDANRNDRKTVGDRPADGFTLSGFDRIRERVYAHVHLTLHQDTCHVARSVAPSPSSSPIQWMKLLESTLRSFLLRQFRHWCASATFA